MFMRLFIMKFEAYLKTNKCKTYSERILISTANLLVLKRFYYIFRL